MSRLPMIPHVLRATAVPNQAHLAMALILLSISLCSATEPSPEYGGNLRGFYFSDDLYTPRLGQPALREHGEDFPVLIGLIGTYSTGDVSAALVGPDGVVRPLTVLSIAAQEPTPANELGVMLYEEGIVEVQEITVAVPVGTPADVYGITVDVGAHHYESVNAVRVYDDYPASWGFIHITDPHVGYDADAYSAAERLGFFVEEANFLNPEIVILTGDICDNQNAGHDWPQQFLDVISGLRVPVYVMPGNHDYYNDGESHDPAGWMRYFHEINRFENSVVRLGSARFYGLNTRWDNGLFQFYRCEGPSTEALDWAEADITTLGSSDKPRLWLMHGPNYDTMTWNTNNVSRVRDIMSANEFALALSGHTHRFETYLNSGTNSFGRDDFSTSDDWGRDVAFPGYPLHVQTSSLGKDESLAASTADELRATGDPEAEGLASGLESLADRAESGGSRGAFGDAITWRWVQVEGTEVAFFTADTDGDGYRNTETPWPLGDIQFTLDSQPDSLIVSTVSNLHHETWTDVRHYIPADAGTDYHVEGGSLLRRLPDGTAVVAVDSVGSGSTSTVTLTPQPTGLGEDGSHFALRLHPATPNPCRSETRFAFELSFGTDVALEIYTIAGRLVTTLVRGHLAAGPHTAVWDGTDDRGDPVSSGIYLVRLRGAGRKAATTVVLVK